MLELRDKIKINNAIEEICAIMKYKSKVYYGILVKCKKNQYCINYYNSEDVVKVEI